MRVYALFMARLYPIIGMPTTVLWACPNLSSMKSAIQKQTLTHLKTSFIFNIKLTLT